MRESSQSCVSLARVSHRGIHLTGYHRPMPLIGVSLRGVHLTDVHLIGIYLAGMHLTGVYLIGMHLIGISITLPMPRVTLAEISKF
jgi:hypothetical protein